MRALWKTGLIACGILVGLVGHQGGELTYGEAHYHKAFDILIGNEAKPGPSPTPGSTPAVTPAPAIKADAQPKAAATEKGETKKGEADAKQVPAKSATTEPATPEAAKPADPKP